MAVIRSIETDWATFYKVNDTNFDITQIMKNADTLNPQQKTQRASNFQNMLQTEFEVREPRDAIPAEDPDLARDDGWVFTSGVLLVRRKYIFQVTWVPESDRPYVQIQTGGDA